MKYSIIVFLFVSIFSQAQTSLDEAEAKYNKTIQERAAKITSSLVFSDTTKATRVQSIIAQQYKNLRAIHDPRNSAIKNLKEQYQGNKETLDNEIKKVENTANDALLALHKAFLNKLAIELDNSQIETIKNGMTYNVLPITYKGYQEMLPDLSDTQKTQILVYLTEAREFAMDAESSDKKHAWFGKYKGKINNYLSAAGIDMKKAGKEWEERIKAKRSNP
jgi:Protein of unknown function (DUF3826)